MRGILINHLNTADPSKVAESDRRFVRFDLCAAYGNGKPCLILPRPGRAEASGRACLDPGSSSLIVLQILIFMTFGRSETRFPC